MKLRSTLTAALFVVALSPKAAVASPIIGAQLFATGGHVVATFLGQSAGFTNDLYLFSAGDLIHPLALTGTVGPGYAEAGLIFSNHSTPPGTSIDLGNFAAGTELVFGIFVRDTGFTYFMGPAARNPDLLAHGAVDNGLAPPFPGFLPPPPGALGVGFEDIFGGGDLDYDDLGFGFTNVVTAVPEPATLLLLGSGLAAAAWRGRRRTRV
jgi:hypothetical protein